MQEVFDFLIVDFEEHDAHSVASPALLSLYAFKQLPAPQPQHNSHFVKLSGDANGCFLFSLADPHMSASSEVCVTLTQMLCQGSGAHNPEKASTGGPGSKCTKRVALQ